MIYSPAPLNLLPNRRSGTMQFSVCKPDSTMTVTLFTVPDRKHPFCRLDMSVSALHATNLLR